MKKTCLWMVMVWSLVFMNPLLTAVGLAQDKPITLKWSDYVPQKSWVGQQHEWWANEVAKRTGGKVKVQIFWMESLVKLKDILQGIQSGFTDIGWLSPTYFPSNMPLYLMVMNTMNIKSDYVAATMAHIDTVTNEPNLKAEMNKNGVVMLSPYISGQLQMATKKPFNSILDLKGKSVRSFGGARIKFLENLGMNPTFMGYTDIYEAIDRGTIDCSEMVMQLSNTFKHYEVVKYLYFTNAGGAMGAEFISQKVFERFPKETQEMFLKLRGEMGERFAQGIQDQENDIYKNWSEKHGVILKQASAEDRKAIVEASKKSTEFIIKKAESEGHQAAGKVWAYYQKSLEKFETERAKKGVKK